MDSGGYTYVELEAKEGKIWAAGMPIEVKVGDTISFQSGSFMTNFHSQTLDKTFESIYFVPYFQVKREGGALAAASAKPATMKDSGFNHKGVAGESPKPMGSPEPGSISKAEEGYTIAELFAERKSLEGKRVKVQGKVMKFNSGIIGKNWIHLQDGTGKEGENDLTLTTQQIMEKGKIVVAEGILSIDKDFGAGYLYPVIIEETNFTVVE